MFCSLQVNYQNDFTQVQQQALFGIEKLNQLSGFEKLLGYNSLTF